VVKASRTSTTKIFGVGPVVAATAIGLTGDVTRFPNRDHFASFNGTAPIDVSSGGKKVYRLSRRGSRHLNHALHMAAVTQIRHRHSEGRAYYERKVAEGKGHKEALRCLKRRISDALYACMVEDAKRDGRLLERGPGGQSGNGSVSSAAGSHPRHRLFGQATPGPAVRLRQPTEPRLQRRLEHGRRAWQLHGRRLEKRLDKQRGLDRGCRDCSSEPAFGVLFGTRRRPA